MRLRCSFRSQNVTLVNRQILNSERHVHWQSVGRPSHARLVVPHRITYDQVFLRSRRGRGGMGLD
jgi:hypothetical protein